MTTNVVSSWLVHDSSISMFYSMSCVIIKRELVFASMAQVEIHCSKFL
jgi:hypothetical protein